ncbi:hypothetical protein BC351_10665 [Paenibacillus ferrarius]|uniref:Uncharacterized protein n=1 Tax=Paenibacillus ferrarius TaxID=1469647 RepID=A0A1V4H901_9BACL|nr:hypothetical protein [Paenibacillus ferrarius]OPH47643.1 hypothetical protein BC351_10665 [Paenibacillus ferrarius]
MDLYNIITWVFSGLGIALFSSKSKIKLVFNPFTIITAPKEEELFLSSSIKTFRQITLYIFFVIFATAYFVLITVLDKSEGSSNTPLHIVFKWWSSIIFLAILLFLMTIIIIKKFRNYYFNKLTVAIRDKKRSGLFLFLLIVISMVVYFILLSLMYGVLINITILNIGESHNNTTLSSSKMLLELPLTGYKELIYTVFALSIAYFISLIPLIKTFRLISNSKLTVTIKMKNGTIYHNKYIINGDIDGFILIADENKASSIGKQMIQKIEIDEIKFTTILTNFGKVTIYPTHFTSNILLPPHYK